MNILYIEHYAGSPKMGMEFRPYYLAREWVKMGHSVRIVAGDYSHLRIQNPEVKTDYQEEVIDGITYTWIKTGAYESNGIARAMTMFRFVGKLRQKAKWIAREWRPDVIITSSTYPLDTFAGQRIRRYTRNSGLRGGKGALLIHEVHDMWPITLTEIGGMRRSNPFVLLMQFAENSFCRNADVVVSLLCAAKDYFVQHGMQSDHFRSITNGIVSEEWENPEELPEEHRKLLKKLHDENKTIICFFGGIRVSYAIEYLIKAKESINDDRVAVVIVGEGNQKEDLQKLEVDGVFFLPQIPKKAIPSLLEAVDCCYVGALRNDMFRFGISMNKLFDSMMSGKPILYAADAPNNYIRDYDCGISVEAENVEALAEGIRSLMRHMLKMEL